MGPFEEKLQKCTTELTGAEHLVAFLVSASSLNTNCSVQLTTWYQRKLVIIWLDMASDSANHRGKGDFVKGDWPKRLKGQQ